MLTYVNRDLKGKPTKKALDEESFLRVYSLDHLLVKLPLFVSINII
jgi:hypothetical protein